MSDLTEKPEEARLSINSIHEEFKHVLTPEAAEALAAPIYSTIGVRESLSPVKCPCGSPPEHNTKSVEYTRSVYLSLIARSPEGIARAAKLIYEEVNKLASKGLVKGHLALLSTLKLAHPAAADLSIVELGPGLPATAIFCFPHVPMELKLEGPYFVEEGSVGHIDLEPELEPKVLKRTSVVAQMQAKMAAETIAEMERCCPEAPCFVDECGKCSGGPKGC